MNLIEGIQEEMNRVRELIPLYDSLPNGVGVFGSTMLKQKLKEAEKAIASGDAIEMIKVYHDLKECE